MSTKYLKTLEYDKVLAKLSSYTKTYLGKELASKLSPEFNKSAAQSSLELTKEAVSLIYRKGNIPLSELPDISVNIKSLESSGILSAASLLNIARFLKISREVKEYFFSSDDIDLEEYTKLYDRFDLLYTNKNIEE